MSLLTESKRSGVRSRPGAASALLVFVVVAFGCSTSRPTSTAGASPARVTRLAPGQGGAEVCFNALDDDDNGLLEEGCGVPQGTPQFVLSWDEPSADVDLWVSDARGEVARFGSATNTGLTKTTQCPNEADTCLGQPRENVVLQEWSDEAAGRYAVRVRLESLGAAAPPIVARLGVKTHQGVESFSIVLDAVGNEERLAFDVPPPRGHEPKKK